ncbi:hypothetical protein LCGC14_1337840 [marine sediment metagenome]|uniref:HEPN domain-containing protein n=1 Tax=marine sediment metagenome TaxID=412755 RepID=A0A0F9KEE2_9ZZZZ
MEVCLNIKEAHKSYDWFFHSFPDYKNNHICSPEDIMIMKKLERFLVDCGE